jgi:CubicO group peptidase (beta-lactamase class C family)
VAREVKPFLDKRKHASLAVAVVTPKGKRTYGFGTVTLDGKDQTPDEHTLYEIGSVTKLFTGTLLAQVVLEKKVRLDDPVQPWLPADWKLPRRDDRDITFLHLATHTSGLPSVPKYLTLANALNGTTDDPYARFDAAAVASVLPTLRLDQPIGSKHDYSNLGVGLLGHALARADRADSYEDLLAKRILGPLGMGETSVRLSDRQKTALAPGHKGSGEPAVGWTFPTLQGAGAVRSNARDMLRFLEAAMGKAETPVGPAIAFAQQPWRELTDKGEEVGLCWIRSATPRGVLFYHAGATGGYSSFLGFHPTTGVGVVVLCNCDEVKPVNDLGIDLLAALEK